MRWFNLEKLIELKLASGKSAAHRLRDLADVQELIKLRGLGSELSDHIDSYVRAKYLELWDAVARAGDFEEPGDASTVDE